VCHGIFLGFIATVNNTIFLDSVSNQIKCTRHVVFGVAFYQCKKKPPYTEQSLPPEADSLAVPNPPTKNNNIVDPDLATKPDIAHENTSSYTDVSIFMDTDKNPN